MIAIVTPDPSKPSSFCATSAPVWPTAFFKSISAPPPVPGGGSETVWTGYTAVTPGTAARAPACAAGTLTETPFQRTSNERRCVTESPWFAAFLKNAVRSAASAALLPPLAVGGVLNWTNQAWKLSFDEPPGRVVAPAETPSARTSRTAAKPSSGALRLNIHLPFQKRHV